MQDLIDKLQLKVKSYKHQAEEAVSDYLGFFFLVVLANYYLCLYEGWTYKCIYM